MSKKKTLALLAVTMAMCGTIGFASACKKEEPAPEPDPPKMEQYNPGDQIIEEQDGEFKYVDGELVEETVTGKKVTVKYVISETAYISLSGSKITELKIDGYKGDITKVSIPDIENSLVVDNVRASVVGVANNAFYGCETLEEVDLSKENLSLTFEIGNSAFENCTSLTKVKLPENIYTTSGAIGNNAFKNATALTEINLGDKIEKIGSGAFYNCSSLTSIAVPKNITVIKANTFAYCDKLTSLSIDGGANLKSIGDNAFQATGISTLDLSSLQNLRYIGSRAFESTGLSAVKLPASVTSIGNRAFFDCKNLTSIEVPFLGNSIAGAQSYNPSFNEIYGVNGADARSLTVTIDQAASIPQEYFKNGKSIKSLTITSFVKEGAYRIYDADGVSFNRVDLTEEEGIYAISKTVGNGAFNGCENMTSVSLPSDVESIGNLAFNDCVKLTSFTVPAGVEKIGSQAFANCVKLSSVKAAGATGSYDIYLPDKVAYVGTNAFENCILLTSVHIPASIEEVGNKAFYGCPVTTLWLGRLDGVKEVLDEFDEVAGYRYISLSPQSWFDTKTKNVTLTAVTVDALYAVPDSAFEGLYAVTNVSLKFAAVDETPYEKDKETGLAEFARPYELPTVATIGENAFKNCSQLASVTINDEKAPVTEIGDYAFANTALTTFTVSDKVEKLGSGILAGAYNLNSVTIERHDFIKTAPAASGLGETNERISLGNITQKLFAKSSSYSNNCYLANNYYIPNNLRTVTLKGVNTLENDTFNGWTGLNTINVEFSKLSIGFSQYGATIGSSAFYGCEGADFNITGAANVSSINSYAFYHCKKLTTDEYKSFSNIKTIGNNAFSGCSGLEEVVIFPSVTSIGNSAFYDCPNVAALHIANFANFRSSQKFLYNIFGSTTSAELDEMRGVYVTKYTNSLPLALKTLTIAGLNSIDDLYHYNGSTYKFLSDASAIEVISLDLPAAEAVGNKMIESSYNPFSDCTSLKKVFLPASYDKLYYTGSSSWSNAPLSAETYTYTNYTPSDYGNYWHYTTVNYESVVTEWEKAAVTPVVYTVWFGSQSYQNTAENGVLTRSTIFVPEMEGQKVVGYYTNSSFSGSPVSFPYYSTSYKTLYAKVAGENENLELVSNSNYFTVDADDYSARLNYSGSSSTSLSPSYTLRVLETGTLTFTARLSTDYGQLTATHYPVNGSSKTVLTINNHYSYSSNATENTHTNEYTNTGYSRTVSVQVKAGDTITFSYNKSYNDYLPSSFDSLFYNISFSKTTEAEPTKPTAPAYTAPAAGGYDLALLLGDALTGTHATAYEFNNAVGSYLYSNPSSVTAKLVTNGMILNAKYDYDNQRVEATSTSLPSKLYIDYSYTYPKVYMDMGGQMTVSTDYDNNWSALRSGRPTTIDGSNSLLYSEFEYDEATRSYYKVEKNGSYSYVTMVTVASNGNACLTFARYYGDACDSYIQYTDVNSTTVNWPSSATINGAIDMGAL